LEEQVASLEKELEVATEAGLELDKMLSEFLSAQKGSEDLSKSVELLQQQLNKQQAKISSMQQALNAKVLEVRRVRCDMNDSHRDRLIYVV
jgi:predicted  nucleic acid-binding Zn-ribbon protein